MNTLAAPPFAPAEQPDTQAYVGTPFPDQQRNSQGNITAIPGEFIEADINHWATVYDNAKRVGNEAVSVASADLAQILLQRPIQYSRTIALGIMATSFGISRLGQHLNLSHDTFHGASIAEQATNPDLFVLDMFDDQHGAKSQVFLSHSMFTDFFGATPAELGNVARYYESTDLYVQASYPANPSRSLRRNYQRAAGEQLNADNFVTVIPRLKTKWLTREQ